MINKINFAIAVATMFGLAACGKSENQSAETMGNNTSQKSSRVRISGEMWVDTNNNNPDDGNSCRLTQYHILKPEKLKGWYTVLDFVKYKQACVTTKDKKRVCGDTDKRDEGAATYCWNSYTVFVGKDTKVIPVKQ
jgi:hypothetical protein